MTSVDTQIWDRSKAQSGSSTNGSIMIAVYASMSPTDVRILLYSRPHFSSNFVLV